MVRFLDDENAKMTVLYLDTLGEPKNGPVQQELEKITGFLSTPQVFVNGRFVSGGKDMEKVPSLKGSTYLVKEPDVLKMKMKEAGATFWPKLPSWIQNKAKNW